MELTSRVKIGLLLLVCLAIPGLFWGCGEQPAPLPAFTWWDYRPFPLLRLPKTQLGTLLPVRPHGNIFLTLDAHAVPFLGNKRMVDLGDLSARIRRWKEMESIGQPTGPGPLTPLLSPWKPDGRDAQALIALDPALKFAQVRLLLSACRAAGLPDAALVARRVSPPVTIPDPDDELLFCLRFRWEEISAKFEALDLRQVPLCSYAINFRTSASPDSSPWIELTAQGLSPALRVTDGPRQAGGLTKGPEETGTGVICIHPRDDATVAAFFRALEESARQGYQAVLIEVE
ncbi:MAG: hypothetical protein KA419_15505 [Acidobacteria bacterium]|nr:hypothetical protein [Acidobacteriota bacterium]